MIHNLTVYEDRTNILVVDSTPDNLNLLTVALEAGGYKVRTVTSGAQALQTARSQAPDLILLDIPLPDMPGDELCRCLKENDELKYIPVLFITAPGETNDKVKGFALGGADYITKPFRSEEVLARVKLHLRLRQLQLEVDTHNATMEALVQMRTSDVTGALTRLDNAAIHGNRDLP